MFIKLAGLAAKRIAHQMAQMHIGGCEILALGCLPINWAVGFRCPNHSERRFPARHGDIQNGWCIMENPI